MKLADPGLPERVYNNNNNKRSSINVTWSRKLQGHVTEKRVTWSVSGACLPRYRVFRQCPPETEA